MSYDSYKQFLKGLSDQELEAEIAKTHANATSPKASERAEAAWTKLNQACLAEQQGRSDTDWKKQVTL